MWAPSEGRIRALKNAWGKEPRSHTVKIFISSIPILTYPLGEWAYYRSASERGEQNVLAPHNLWRAFWHLLGGLILTLPFINHSIWSLWTAVLIFLGAWSYEFLSDISKNGFHLKNLFDVLSWTAGSLIVVYWSL